MSLEGGLRRLSIAFAICALEHIRRRSASIASGDMASSEQLTSQNFGGLRGLTDAEATARLQAEGLNELPATKARNLLQTAWGVLREPMILLLMSAAVIYFFIGELRDALVLMGSIFVVVGIDLYQQRKTEHALEALRDLSSPRAMVIRDGTATAHCRPRRCSRRHCDCVGRRSDPCRRRTALCGQSVGGRVVADRRVGVGA